ncbi:MAG: hypothetical protein V4590_03925 [Bacteroidota bacterium]
MFNKYLNHFFLFITSRELLILMGLIIIGTSVPMFIEQFLFIKHCWGTIPQDALIGEMEELIDGLAGILVAAGVFFEERETIRKLATRKEETHSRQLYHNEIAHHNGMGILLIGLFMEIGSQVLEMPQRVINTDGIEMHIITLCFILSIFAFVILLDFVKDFIKTYFKDYKPHASV